jgi:Fur family transcriptional regulator, ferric uptake regulator
MSASVRGTPGLSSPGLESEGRLAPASGESGGAERAAIRDAGLRATASRIAVLRELRAAGRPLSHADIVGSLEEQPWDRATLYRNLIDLAGVGLARRVELGDRVWRFDASTQGHQAAGLHPHFVCTMCGSVECLPRMDFVPPRRGVPAALVRREVEVQVRGVCDACD